jgi:asparaginyl-tRNA synthetase
MKYDRANLRIVRQSAIRSVVDHFMRKGVTCIDDPPSVVLITGACENVSTLYELADAHGHYLAQTAQLYLEVELQTYSSVYCRVRSYRADRLDRRHLNEFELIEEEFVASPATGTELTRDQADRLLDTLLARITAGVGALLIGALASANTIEDLGGDVARIEQAVSLAASGWPAITYRNALELLNASGQFGRLEFGVDLGPQHEALLVELMSAKYGFGPIPVFITHYPERIKFFNMKVDPAEQDVVLSADLLLPTAGEAVGSAVREDNYFTLANRLEASTMLQQLQRAGTHSRQDFEPYLEMISSGRVQPHAGYGIGLERVLQFLLAADDIRSVSGIYQLFAELAGTAPSEASFA